MSELLLEPMNPELDLVLERVVDVPPRLIWKAWTEAEHVKQWFAPRPWATVECEIDLRPGGVFRTVMRSPEGDEFPGVGCYLEIVPEAKLSWTNVLLPGFRPAESSDLPFTAVITLEPHGAGTRYVARAIHRDPEGRRKHEEMGFREGWSMCLDQLVEMAKGW